MSCANLLAPSVNRKQVSLRLGFAAAVFAVLGLAACAASTALQTPAARGSDPLDLSSTAATADVVRLQSQLMALADTEMQRIVTETAPTTWDKDLAVREFSQITRLNLCSALIAIATGPDPVDALFDILTFSTLVADAQRSAARGKATDSPEARLLTALELNEADAWRLAERWLDPAARSALRERILSWPGERRAGVEVSYVRLSDLPRTGSATTAAGEGVLDSLRGAVMQAEQVRLLGERSLYLAQKMQFMLRWQAEFFTYKALSSDESRRLLEGISGLTASADSAVREVAGMPAQVSREREAALQDLFARIERERRAMLEQIAVMVQKERSATLAEAGAVITAQQKALFDELSGMVGSVEGRAAYWAGFAFLVGLALIVVLLVGALGTGLLYRRLARRMDRQLPDQATASPATRRTRGQ